MKCRLDYFYLRSFRSSDIRLLLFILVLWWWRIKSQGVITWLTKSAQIHKVFTLIYFSCCRSQCVLLVSPHSFVVMSVIHVFHYHFFVSLLATRTLISNPSSCSFCYLHMLTLSICLSLSGQSHAIIAPISTSSHQLCHHGDLEQQAADWLLCWWVGGCEPQHLELMDSVAPLQGPSTHIHPRTQMPWLVIDGQWESQPLQT